ncbi:glycoside hydrolase family 16 protein [Streptomyces nanshensis]|uniref:glycoside hydrolase family 16 protein n=1 Tax=Streptomyces nanshensis TaxID=518642 RepID=UPI00085C1677|nr:glycoside hydrolase family 16 protein [Streptomyces nanshensis]
MNRSRLRGAAYGAAAAGLLALAALPFDASATDAAGDTGKDKGAAAAPAAGSTAGAADDGDTAAERFGWGKPVPEGTDEFDYGSADKPEPPDTAKWELPGGPGECGEGHDGNGRRCTDNSQVVGGKLRQLGAENGDSGWMASKFGQRYGRWEARVRSEATGADSERTYHPLLILWPDSNRWPQDGEYDFLENTAPGEKCAKAFIHYPHDPNAEVQQEPAESCGVNLTEWHNVAVEWTPDHVKGFVDGKEWFSFSGGENDVRDCIQCAPSMHQTIQLDNFFGEGMQTAAYEVDWTRAYSIDGVSEPAARS